MTIFTKPATKKGEKSILPLVGAGSAPSAPAAADDASNNSTAASIIMLRRGRQLSPATAAILLMVAVLGFSIGTIGGLFYYRQYAQSRNQHFHAFCKIPYDSSNFEPLHFRSVNMFQPFRDASLQGFNNDASSDDNSNNSEGDAAGNEPSGDPFFNEEFELGLGEEDSYSKIDVPLFRDQRPARFLHDFKFNQSGIIDSAARRCFIMPLDRETVLPPRSLRDLIQKMQEGYYNIDTSVLKKTMRVVTPELTDYTDVSPRITKECVEMKIYSLEKVVSGVYKRSTDIVERLKFAEFGGNHISLIDIQNLDELN